MERMWSPMRRNCRASVIEKYGGSWEGVKVYDFLSWPGL